jgi:carboxymethylenebutenolidase
MPTSTDTVTTPDGDCRVTIATPDGPGPWPAVVMYPDAGGARATFDEMAARLAGYGYLVLVPDVYYRHPGWRPFDMASVFSDQAERRRLFGMIQSVTPDHMAADATAFFDYLAGRPDVLGERFGTTGYCMGGRTSLIVAGRVPERVAAAMSFHGGGLVADDPGSPHLLATEIKAAVYVGGAENDASFTAADAQTLGAALAAAGVEHTIEFYSAGHGFAVPDNAPYDPAAAERHWSAMQRVFGDKLG